MQYQKIFFTIQSRLINDTAYGYLTETHKTIQIYYSLVFSVHFNVIIFYSLKFSYVMKFTTLYSCVPSTYNS